MTGEEIEGLGGQDPTACLFPTLPAAGGCELRVVSHPKILHPGFKAGPPGLGRSPGGGHGKPLHCSCLENPMDRGAWRVTVHGVAKSWTQLKQLSMRAIRQRGYTVLIEAGQRAPGNTASGKIN